MNNDLSNIYIPKKRCKFFNKYCNPIDRCINNLDRYLHVNEKNNNNLIKVKYKFIDSLKDLLVIRLIKKTDINIINLIYNEGISDLPVDIVDNIVKMLKKDDFIEIKLNLEYTEKYPFIAPKWSLKEIKYNFKTSFNINGIINYYVNLHNELYEKEWTGVFTIESDILYFISRINFLDELLLLK